MIDKLKKALMILAVVVLIWAIIDPVSAAAFVKFLWERLLEAVTAFLAFLRNVFT